MTLGDIIRMEEMVKKQIAEREQAKAEGATEERAKIVEYLRYYGMLRNVAANIEAGEHLK